MNKRGKKMMETMRRCTSLKEGLMNGKERDVSLLRFENSPDGRDVRELL